MKNLMFLVALLSFNHALADPVPCVNGLRISTAIIEKDLASLQRLLRKGYNPNLLDCKSGAPIVLASAQNSNEFVEALIQAKADVNLKSNRGFLYYGSSALSAAVENGNLENVKSLIKAKADLNEIDLSGDSPIILAFQHDYFEIIKALILAKADLRPNFSKKTPLSQALGFLSQLTLDQRLELIDLMIKNGVDVNQSDENITLL